MMSEKTSDHVDGPEMPELVRNPAIELADSREEDFRDAIQGKSRQQIMEMMRAQLIEGRDECEDGLATFQFYNDELRVEGDEPLDLQALEEQLASFRKAIKSLDRQIAESSGIDDMGFQIGEPFDRV